LTHAGASVPAAGVEGDEGVRNTNVAEGGDEGDDGDEGDEVDEVEEAGEEEESLLEEAAEAAVEEGVDSSEAGSGDGEGEARRRRRRLLVAGADPHRSNAPKHKCVRSTLPPVTRLAAGGGRGSTP
jgi:hypothetical protein